MNDSVDVISKALEFAPAVSGAALAAGLKAREPSEKTRGQIAFDTLINFGVGYATAYFLGGYAVEFFSVSSKAASTGIEFILGAVGMQLFDWLRKDALQKLLAKFGGIQ